jgi:hypothetical protein
LRGKGVLSAVCVAAFLSAYLCGGALGAQSASLEVSFSPERLGASTTILFGFRISSVPPASQSPLTNLSVMLPKEMGFATSGLGLENCLLFSLEASGTLGCPTNSLMGRGVATAEIPIGGEEIAESAQIEVFSAPVREGHLSLWVFADAHSPVNAEPVFPAAVLPASQPYGETIDATLPLVPTLPGAPDVAVTRFHMALGPTPSGPDHFLYHSWADGRRVTYAPKGLLLPPVCPRGGFPFKAQFVFQDQTEATAQTNVPCPQRPRRLRHQRRPGNSPHVRAGR